MENENEIIDSPIDTETTENQEEVVEKEEVDVEALLKENATLKAQKEHFRKKAETVANKTVGVEITPKIESGLKVEDVLELASEGITHKEDVELAKKWTEFNKKPMSEALKDPMFKTMLGQKREERTTAEATQTKGGPQGAKRVTGEDLLAKAVQKGEFPQTDDDMDKMIKAKFDAKVRK